MYFVLSCVLLAFISALVFTELARRLALRMSVVDIPNERSSHKKVVPRGGGLAIVVVVLTYVLVFPIADYQYEVLLVITGLAILGWSDDRYSLTAGIRLLVQSAIAVGTILTVGPFKFVEFLGMRVLETPFSLIFTFLWIVWMINLYNFMDGIDGIAGVETVVAATTMGIWFYAFGIDTQLLLFCWVLAAASLGFLVFNWPPAKIFMGDVGSVCIGGIFAILAIIGVNEYDIPLAAYIILLSVFIADSTITVIRRLYNRENIFRAHRSHYYQRAVSVGWSHKQVSVVILVANLALAIIGSAAANRMSPEWLWPLLAAFILGLMIMLVVHREQNFLQTTNPN